MAIGSDHAGFSYKQEIAEWLRDKGGKVLDHGVGENRSVDYPDHAHPVARSVEEGVAACHPDRQDALGRGRKRPWSGDGGRPVGPFDGWARNDQPF